MKSADGAVAEKQAGSGVGLPVPDPPATQPAGALHPVRIFLPRMGHSPLMFPDRDIYFTLNRMLISGSVPYIIGEKRNE
jgi:hypothetical protein